MLKRVLEPEVMDSPEEARDYDAMDHRVVNRSFVEDFLRACAPAGPVLDVGTGTAQIPVVLCRMAPAVKVVAIEYAGHMLDLAARNVRQAGLADRIQLQRCDAKQLPFADRSFSAAISNSIVHHIPEPVRVLQEMVRVTTVGGCLFVRDLLRPETEEELRRLVTVYAGEANAHQRAMFDASLRAALTLEEVRELVRSLGFAAESVRQTSDRHWTWTTGATRETGRNG